MLTEGGSAKEVIYEHKGEQYGYPSRVTRMAGSRSLASDLSLTVASLKAKVSMVLIQFS